MSSRLGHGQRVTALALAAGLPALACALGLLWFTPINRPLKATVSLIIVGCFVTLLALVKRAVNRPLGTLANLLDGLRQGDYSLRARARVTPRDQLDLALHELNALGETLREQRLGAIEATALLSTVMAEIDVAVFSLDENGVLQLVNHAGARLLARPRDRLEGVSMTALGSAGTILDACRGGAPRRVFAASFPGNIDPEIPSGERRWSLRRTSFRQGGRALVLLVLSDVSQALRDQERDAWKRLIRVLSHEIGNSLTPIRSIAESLRSAASLTPKPDDWDRDARLGLDVIARRSESLRTFMGHYAELARLPPPDRQPLHVVPWIERIATLEDRVPLRLIYGEPATLHADAAQLEGALINLIRNAADACLTVSPHGEVTLSWRRTGDALVFEVLDEGCGLAEHQNVFVPFFSTKPGGSGIGLVLARQIVEAHGGVLSLRPRDDARGCIAQLRLPHAGLPTRPATSTVPSSHASPSSTAPSPQS